MHTTTPKLSLNGSFYSETYHSFCSLLLLIIYTLFLHFLTPLIYLWMVPRSQDSSSPNSSSFPPQNLLPSPATPCNLLPCGPTNYVLTSIKQETCILLVYSFSSTFFLFLSLFCLLYCFVFFILLSQYHNISIIFCKRIYMINQNNNIKFPTCSINNRFFNIFFISFSLLFLF